VCDWCSWLNGDLLSFVDQQLVIPCWGSKIRNSNQSALVCSFFTFPFKWSVFCVKFPNTDLLQFFSAVRAPRNSASSQHTEGRIFHWPFGIGTRLHMHVTEEKCVLTDYLIELSKVHVHLMRCDRIC
jgi:hypothetical protein